VYKKRRKEGKLSVHIVKKMTSKAAGAVSAVNETGRGTLTGKHKAAGAVSAAAQNRGIFRKA